MKRFAATRMMRRVCATTAGSLCLLIGLFWAPGLQAAESVDEHASHHPGQAGGAMPAGAPAPTGGGGMMEQMGEMMKGMGKTPLKELYPSLMALPELTLEKRQEVELQSAERMHTGVMLMGQALDVLNAGTLSGDYAAMHEATTQLREGIAQLESGIAARRALSEGRAPREVALTWFKQEMNLSPAVSSTAHDSFGGVRFHLTVIALLAAFAAIMIAMYFFKMRRAADLLGRLSTGTPASEGKNGTSPPGASNAVPSTPAASVPAKTTSLAAVATPVAPVFSGWKGILRVNRTFDETPGVKTFRFTAMDGGPVPFTYLPGQYLIVYPMIAGKRTPRSYTISSSPTQRHYCEFTVKREQDGKGVSKYLYDGLQEGELLEASGPIGSFIFTGVEAKSVVLISGGVGITPFMSYVRHLTDIGWPGDIYFIYTCRHVSDFIYRTELEQLCTRHPKLHLVVTITRPNQEPWSGLTGHLTKEIIAQRVPDIAARLIYVCGPDNMMRAAQAALLELEVPSEQVKTEAFSASQVVVPESGEKLPQADAKTSSGEAPRPAAQAKSADLAGTAEAPPPPADGAVASQAVVVTFAKSGKTAPLPPDKSILEASEDVGVNIPFECRVGICNKCKVKLLSGSVTMAVEDALAPGEKAQGIILSCQAKSTGNVVVDA